MESAYNNNHHHHHHLQDQLVVVGSSSSSSILSSNYYGLGTTTHAWGTTTTPTTPFIMNTNNNSNNNNIPSPSSSHYAGPEFHSWANTDDFGSSSQLLTINKDDDFSINHNYYRKYADLLNATTTDSSCSKIFSAGDLMYGGGGGGRSSYISQIFPSSSSNLDMNLEALDLLTSSSFSGNNYSQNYPINGIFRDHHHQAFPSNYAAQQPQQQVPLHEEDDTSYKISSAPGRGSRGSAETKRISSKKIEPKPPSLKKSRIEARPSCPPFKVTKEKLGDRIATLQQLVAPFGKTDTASVLMEAIGYIKFLQDQVETLSVPYMKASRNKSTRSIEEGIIENQNKKDGESKRDLRSRGLCLVPLSCLSYITDGGAAVVWPPPHFGGGPT